MRNLVLSIAAAAAVMAAAPLANAQTAPIQSGGRVIFGVEPVGAAAPVQDVQFLFGGRNYCWYPDGWRGAGYYWCGYAYRRGLGWGGPVGWHGWSGGDRGGRGGDHGGFGGHVAMAHGGPVGGHGGAPGVGGHSGGDHGGAPAGGGGHAGGGDHGGGHANGGDHGGGRDGH